MGNIPRIYQNLKDSITLGVLDSALWRINNSNLGWSQLEGINNIISVASSRNLLWVIVWPFWMGFFDKTFDVIIDRIENIILSTWRVYNSYEITKLCPFRFSKWSLLTFILTILTIFPKLDKVRVQNIKKKKKRNSLLAHYIFLVHF